MTTYKTNISRNSFFFFKKKHARKKKVDTVKKNFFKKKFFSYLKNEQTTMRVGVRPLICVLNSGKLTIPEICLKHFDWCQVQDDFYTTLNAIPRVPDMFLTFENMSPTGRTEMNALPLYMRAKWHRRRDFDHFIKDLQIFQESFANDRPPCHYFVTKTCDTVTQYSSNVFEISPARFMNMNMADKMLNHRNHYWIDFSTLCFDTNVKHFNEHCLPAIRKYHILARMYHDTSFLPVANIAQMRLAGATTLRNYVPFTFEVFFCFFLFLCFV